MLPSSAFLFYQTTFQYTTPHNKEIHKIWHPGAHFIAPCLPLDSIKGLIRLVTIMANYELILQEKMTKYTQIHQK